MHRRLAMLLVLLFAFPAAAGERKPNVIIILADDLGYADVGFQGSKQIPTPHLDALAKRGVRCTSGYVSGPYCSPTRAALLTGRYQTRFGHEFNPHKGDLKVLGLPLSETTIAQRLGALGYVTGLVGKWHLGVAEHFHPLQRGFDEFFGFPMGAHDYFPKGKKAATGIVGGTNNLYRGKEKVEVEGYLTEAFGQEAVAFIDRHKKEPFFLYLAFNAVHTPLQVPQSYEKRFAHVKDDKRRKYCAMTVAMDDAVGAVLAKLRAEDLEEDTLIFFFSDNGGPTNKYAINGSINFPLRGSKGDCWEGGVRVPFVIAWKGKLPAGKTYDHPVIQLDVLPTSIAAAGGQTKGAWKLDGVNLFPYLRGEKLGPPHEYLHWRFGEFWAIRHGSYKVVRTWDNERPELYDVVKDIGETKDLSKQDPDRLRALTAAWERWNAGNVAPLWPRPEPAEGKAVKKGS
jgi:arylsulfatase A-like enzyme